MHVTKRCSSHARKEIRNVGKAKEEDRSERLPIGIREAESPGREKGRDRGRYWSTKDGGKGECSSCEDGGLWETKK